jgi:hypothetical protein
MPLKDGEIGDIYHWMLSNDPAFVAFMTSKDHFEGQRIRWQDRLTHEQQIDAARQYKFHTLYKEPA